MAFLEGKTGVRRWIGPKRVILLALFASLCFAAWHFWRQGLLSPATVFVYVETNPVLAPIIFVLLYSLCILFVVPSLPFNLAAGFLWGPYVGSVVALGGSVLGSVAAFVFARTALGQPFARKFDNQLVSWMQKELEEKGWGVVGFICVNPAIPLGPQNFVFGLTSMRLWTLTWATTVFLYPPVLAVSFLGEATGSMILEGESLDIVRWAMLVSAATVVLVGFRVLMKFYFSVRRNRREKAPSSSKSAK
ncbi:MAG: VTT domain-containing protein [Pseudodesulfovibrio sp.]|uniref:TVP38/TMEM64 family membrane protein n=1 Tax=Pseudodesulfovibrio aespoeensis (strain ATCC 700646 / DSM 10631 / Aspo-2) TaxID=643562 RepID=E6VUG6_PSEA9|nr:MULTISPECIES: VTT domain-containing protein [Pseudodesulfovibrio]MBU4244129.1 VTT domain-containing protein [Pseudomonadota bacterium]ADU61111.1 SNARE associated Golgi protein-like protein [Pseudodesulfovibrio aespoeensis Aspo-2]MBU4378733.1 VTT domain-containing protein [Pseudomonadota bacterium]MBU4517484.1 VTT domain-containing protein [Pseudomonadota bacterium]MBU4523779.1 VTT domain-containing protein [Pseudomonadota bacterium]